MMPSYTLSMLDSHFETLKTALTNLDGNERAAYLFCNKAETPSELRLIVDLVELIPPHHILSSTPEHVSISSLSYVPAIAKAQKTGQSFILVHNHPNGYPIFSVKDDMEEKTLFRTAFLRSPAGPHGSIICIGDPITNIIGRVWLDEQHYINMDRIRIVGDRLKLFHKDGYNGVQIPQWADRQIKAFGEETQKFLSTLHVGVVGVGGTGSAVTEQLTRLGVGKITVIDDQKFEKSNVNRVYGSRLLDEGTPKVEIANRNAKAVGLNTTIIPIQDTICDETIALSLRTCDVIFGCTDDYLGRAILNRIAVWYYIPVIDMAVVIDSNDGIIKEVTGRITKLLPGKACLRCRRRIPHDKLRAQQLRRLNPSEYSELVKEGYAPELDQTDPSVIMFTTGIAARAVTEFIQMLTGFMGNERAVSEILERFHETEVRFNSRTGHSDCYCMNQFKWGKGDQSPFLDMMW